MHTVRQLLEKKGHQIWSVAPDTTVYEALELMAEKNIGALLVLQNDQLVGLFSERDYARKVILQGKSSKSTSIGELMTKGVLYVSADDAIEDCLGLMSHKRVRHLPVYADKQLIGLVSIGDVVQEILSHRESTIRQLERYITGSYG